MRVPALLSGPYPAMSVQTAAPPLLRESTRGQQLQSVIDLTKINLAPLSMCWRVTQVITVWLQ